MRSGSLDLICISCWCINAPFAHRSANIKSGDCLCRSTGAFAKNGSAHQNLSPAHQIGASLIDTARQMSRVLQIRSLATSRRWPCRRCESTEGLDIYIPFGTWVRSLEFASHTREEQRQKRHWRGGNWCFDSARMGARVMRAIFCSQRKFIAPTGVDLMATWHANCCYQT